jgi:membrane protein insertase Oxa1/YidC/SpoIIIJ
MKLDDNQKQIYKSVINERTNIYIQGLVLGIVLALLITFNTNLAKGNNVCLFIVIAIVVNILYYSLYPKSTYMLEHLKSQDQVKAWLNIYKEMKIRCKVGMIIGFVGYIFLGSGWCS